jgi:hypothetical protein
MLHGYSICMWTAQLSSCYSMVLSRCLTFCWCPRRCRRMRLWWSPWLGHGGSALLQGPYQGRTTMSSQLSYGGVQYCGCPQDVLQYASVF